MFAASAGTGVAPLGAGLVIAMGTGRGGARPALTQLTRVLRCVCHTELRKIGVAIGAKYMIFQASCKAVNAIVYG